MTLQMLKHFVVVNAYTKSVSAQGLYQIHKPTMKVDRK